MSLLTLPHELLLQILDRQYDLNALSQVCRHFHHHFNDRLYLFNIKYRRSRGLFWAAEEGRVSAVRRFLSLLGPDAKVDAEYPHDYWMLFTHPRIHKTCLDLAIAGGHFETVQLLLEYGADPLRRNNKGQASLFLALVSRDDGIIKLISSYINDLPNYWVDSERRNTPLHIASRHGLSDWVRYFLEQGADVDAKDESDWTALRHALETDFRTWPFVALEDPKIRSKKPSPFQVLETVRVLIEFSSDPNFLLTHEYRGERDADTPLVTAAFLGARNMDPKVRALFRFDGDIHQRPPSTEKEVADMVRFSPYELRYVATTSVVCSSAN